MAIQVSHQLTTLLQTTLLLKIILHKLSLPNQMIVTSVFTAITTACLVPFTFLKLIFSTICLFLEFTVNVCKSYATIVVFETAKLIKIIIVMNNEGMDADQACKLQR